jgi:hypothetical protein
MHVDVLIRPARAQMASFPPLMSDSCQASLRTSNEVDLWSALSYTPLSGRALATLFQTRVLKKLRDTPASSPSGGRAEEKPNF